MESYIDRQHAIYIGLHGQTDIQMDAVIASGALPKCGGG